MPADDSIAERPVRLSTLMALPVLETYKDDRRSRVWRVAYEGESLVVKRYVHSWWRHGFSRLVGRHPVQRELRMMRRLEAAGLAVAPAVGHGATWLATRYVGLSLHNMVRLGRFRDDAQRQAVLGAAGGLVARMAEAGWYFRDFKASNLLVDEQDQLWLIDTGSVRRMHGARGREMMLDRLLETLVRAGADERDQSQVRAGANRGNRA